MSDVSRRQNTRDKWHQSEEKLKRKTFVNGESQILEQWDNKTKTTFKNNVNITPTWKNKLMKNKNRDGIPQLGAFCNSSRTRQVFAQLYNKKGFSDFQLKTP